ncbi:MAG: hypothetical protein JNM07_11745 [Phycisphaerae bacterium]|nr:hypothetical protein [Phycisphaerae bacterium]
MMKYAIRNGMTAAMLAAAAGTAMANPTVDGVLNSGEGYTLVAVQTNGTQFGDSNLAQQFGANGSEIGATYAVISGGRLYLMFTGNLESNYNKLEVFFDCTSGGQNTLRGDNVDLDYNGLNRMGDDGSSGGNGLKFDSPFEADYWLGVTIGGGGGPSGYDVYTNAAFLRTGGWNHDANYNSLDYGAYDGSDAATVVTFDGPQLDAYNPNGQGLYLFAQYGPRTTTANPSSPVSGLIEATVNNSNSGGVTSSDASAALGVTTGVEVSIDLNELGYDGASVIKVCAFINGGGHDYVSNQFAAPLPSGYGNMADPRYVNLAAAPGRQWFPVTGCPSDWNGDGSVDDFDFFDFLNDFSAGTADFNLDQSTDDFDFFDFLNAFNVNC